MSTTDFYADLIRRADHCERVSAQRAIFGDGVDGAEDAGKAAAYRHAAEMLRSAVAAAVEEEREAAAHECEVIAALCGGDEEADSPTVRVLRGAARAIRARGESPRGDAASDRREGAE